jgi:endonuclease/exonuclease/phosphatase (EEP) superfamily protein YafD
LYQQAFAIDGQRSAGLALLSRYPQRDLRVLALRQFSLSFRSRNRIALGAAVDTPAGPIHVFNVHLDTRINLESRLEQLGSVARDVESLDGPAIVGGDFNTNDNRWLFHTIPLPFIGRQGAGLVRFMEGRGFRSAFGSRLRRAPSVGLVREDCRRPLDSAPSGVDRHA